MTSVTKNDHSAVSALAGGTGQHTGGQAQALLSGGDRDGPKAAGWDVEIHLGDHQITHKACYRGSRRNMAACGVPAEEVIWPAWPVTTADITAASPLPLAGFEQYWHTAGNRLRESAKWMATILGNAMTDGSGFWVGLNAIRAAYRDFASGTDSVLLQRFRQVYGIRNDDGRAFIAKLRDLAIADSNMKRRLPALPRASAMPLLGGTLPPKISLRSTLKSLQMFPRASSAASSLEVISLLALPSLRLAGCYPTNCIDLA